MTPVSLPCFTANHFFPINELLPLESCIGISITLNIKTVYPGNNNLCTQ